jgi:hypothetical protein
MLTDARGRYVFRNLPAFGGYFLQATKFGYSNAAYGRGGSGSVGGRIALLDGQWFADANVTMWRPSAITGRVVDQTGEPAVAVYVRVLPRVLIAGQPHLAAGPVTTTDDRGVYRIAGLGPGTYVVQVPSVQSSVPASMPVASDNSTPVVEGRPLASRDPMMDTAGSRLQLGRYMTPLAPINGRMAVYPPTFHPNVTSVVEAQIVQLGQSEERAGVDITLKPVPAFTISGVVEGPPEALANLTLRLMPDGLADLGGGSEAATVLLGADGRFTFLNVPAGSFMIVAGRSTTEYEFRNLGSVSKPLPQAPRPVGALTSVAAYGVIAGPSGTSMSSWRYSDEADLYVARMPVSVDADRSDLVVTLRRTATMSGRVVWAEGEEAPPLPEGMSASLSATRVTLFPAGGQAFLGLPRTSTPRTDSVPTDRFVVSGLQAGEYVLSVSLPRAGRMMSVTWNGRDFTNRAFDATSGEDIADVVVTMTTKSVVLSGTVLNERSLPADDAAVIVFPAERDQWSNYGLQPDRVKALATTNTGSYRFQSLPAGDYLVVAVHADLIDGWKDPSFLEKVSRLATRLTLAWNDNKTQDLRMSVVK